MKKPDVSSLQPGYHTLNVRALDNANKWSDVVTTPFVYMELPAKVTSAEYYFDEDLEVNAIIQYENWNYCMFFHYVMSFNL